MSAPACHIHTPLPRARAAFTLLETMMAALVGGIVVLAVAGVFTAMDGMNRRMESRYVASDELARARTVVARAMDTLLMSAEPQRAQQNTQERPPNRLVLEAEPASRVERATRRARLSGAGRIEAPQRLEVVLSRWPLPREMVDEARAAAGDRAADRRPPPGPGAALRCAFELRPDADGTWAMWWRPLPLPDPGVEDPRDTDPSEDPNAVLLVSGLTKCRWTAFDDRERKSAIGSAWATELPAYVELEIATAAGAAGNWMFEVGWTNGVEIAEEPDQLGAPEGGAEDNGASNTGPGGRNQPTGTRSRGTRGGRGG